MSAKIEQSLLDTLTDIGKPALSTGALKNPMCCFIGKSVSGELVIANIEITDMDDPELPVVLTLVMLLKLQQGYSDR